MPLRGGGGAGGRSCSVNGNRPVFSGPVRVLLGPQEDAFTAAGIETFLSSAYTVTSRTDRMGCHLDGPSIEHRDGFNIISDGIVNGSIQVPGSGIPIVLLADRQTTGGYPKIATIVSADLGRIGQARIGEAISFEAVSEEEAERSALAWNERIGRGDRDYRAGRVGRVIERDPDEREPDRGRRLGAGRTGEHDRAKKAPPKSRGFWQIALLELTDRCRRGACRCSTGKCRWPGHKSGTSWRNKPRRKG